MKIALYGTIWVALALLALAALKRNRLAYAAGAALAFVHVLIALGSTYQWNHERAVSETARQASEVYGFAWRGSIYMSYAFVIVWMLDAAFGRGIMREWILRAFFLVIIFNAAIVFASPLGQVFGVAIVAVLLWAWRPRANLHA
jgi:hypothetical protein